MSGALAVAAALVLSGCRGGIVSAAPREAPTTRTGQAAPHLPPPFATPSADNGPRLVARPSGASLRVPQGFRISVFASGLDRPRQIVVAPNGDVFCSEGYANRIVVLRDARGTGRATERYEFAGGLDLPFGMAFQPGFLYVANTGSVVRFPHRPGQTHASGPPQIVTSLPGRGYHQHWTRDVAFDPSGRRMYVSVGSRENVGIEPPPRATILEMGPTGAGRHVYASGLRNAVCLAFRPGTDTLWCTVNERDDLGDSVPPDYVTSVKPGGFYGWPYYYVGQHHDPRMPDRPDLREKVVIPDVLLEPHSAPLGIAFYTASRFPAPYHGDAFVAEHGSWNRRLRSGYKVVRIHFSGGRPAGVSDFVTGWMLSPGSRDVWGRPVGAAVAKDGSLLISDDGGGVIWRVAYGG